jgi:hypothetical protein
MTQQHPYQCRSPVHCCPTTPLPMQVSCALLSNNTPTNAGFSSFAIQQHPYQCRLISTPFQQHPYQCSGGLIVYQQHPYQCRVSRRDDPTTPLPMQDMCSARPTTPLPMQAVVRFLANNTPTNAGSRCRGNQQHPYQCRFHSLRIQQHPYQCRMDD